MGSGKSGPKDQVALHYYYTSLSQLVHDSRGIEIVNLTISLALSAGTLMASAGTPYRLVPAHFYPWWWAVLNGTLNGGFLLVSECCYCCVAKLVLHYISMHHKAV